MKARGTLESASATVMTSGHSVTYTSTRRKMLLAMQCQGANTATSLYDIYCDPTKVKYEVCPLTSASSSCTYDEVVDGILMKDGSSNVYALLQKETDFLNPSYFYLGLIALDTPFHSAYGSVGDYGFKIRATVAGSSSVEVTITK